MRFTRSSSMASISRRSKKPRGSASGRMSCRRRPHQRRQLRRQPRAVPLAPAQVAGLEGVQLKGGTHAQNGFAACCRARRRAHRVGGGPLRRASSTCPSRSLSAQARWRALAALGPCPAFHAVRHEHDAARPHGNQGRSTRGTSSPTMQPASPARNISPPTSNRLPRSKPCGTCLHTGTPVLSIGRQNTLKGDDPGDARRARQPFRLLVREGNQRERMEEADVVLDCTGTYGKHCWLGDGGIPAIGETRRGMRISPMALRTSSASVGGRLRRAKYPRCRIGLLRGNHG